MRSSGIAWIKLSATLSSHETVTLTDSWPHFPKVGRHTHNSPCVLHIGRKASARHILLSASDTPCSWLSESEAMFSSSTLTKLLTRSGRVLIETRLRGRLFPYLLPLREVLRKPNVHYALAPPEDSYTWSEMQVIGGGGLRLFCDQSASTSFATRPTLPEIAPCKKRPRANLPSANRARFGSLPITLHTCLDGLAGFSNNSRSSLSQYLGGRNARAMPRHGRKSAKRTQYRFKSTWNISSSSFHAEQTRTSHESVSRHFTVTGNFSGLTNQ